jgi:carbamoyl-phosphate synthase large subunit
MVQPHRVLVTGAGGAPATNYVRSLRLAPEPFYLIGVDSSPYHLPLAETDEAHLVPRADDPDYLQILNEITRETGAELIFAQPDVEVGVLSAHRDELAAPMFLPAKETIECCLDKFSSYNAWRDAGIKVPPTRGINGPADLEAALTEFGEVWLRPTTGSAGNGSYHTSDLRHAKMWLDSHDGWGSYTAAAYLGPDSVTWQSIWLDGELVVAQGRKRLKWELADRSPTGVTGVTGVGTTVSDPLVDSVAQAAVRAVDAHPHGIFSVDMTNDAEGVPNPTEINIGRFFTTSLFFTAAGLNMPYIFTRLALGEEPPPIARKINPLPAGLLWVRGMDREPRLVCPGRLESAAAELEQRRAHSRGKIPAATD